MQRLRKLDAIMLHRTFIVGERVTIADIFLATALTNAFTGLVDASNREKIPNVVRYVDS
jgi:elongation factor 1-gamma